MGKHTKDIKQQIEDAKKELSIELSGNKIQGDQSYNIGLLTGAEIASRIFLSKWQESERWRDVNEELPPIGQLVWLKNNNEKRERFRHDVGFRCEYEMQEGWYWKDSYTGKGYTHWKPIK